MRSIAFFLLSALCFAQAPSSNNADWIWSARYVVTGEPGRVIENGAIAVLGARIVGALL